jgi:hypothetical protein
LLIAKPEFPWVERERLIAQVIDMAVDGLLSGAKASERKRRVARDRKGGRTAAQGRHGAR